MGDNKVLNYLKDVVENMPVEWLNLTTHRLDIYNEALAKSQFLEQFENLFQKNEAQQASLQQLPTAYDYIRLGHPLSCVLEWTIAKQNDLNPDQVISFSSLTMPVLAVLRKNKFEQKDTLITYTEELPADFNPEVIRNVYGYTFDLKKVESVEKVPEFDGSTLFISSPNETDKIGLFSTVDFFVTHYPVLGSIILVNGSQNDHYSSEIQHVRRRESIAMTPLNCFKVLKKLTGLPDSINKDIKEEENKKLVLKSIREITGTNGTALVGSSGLSIQYAIMMGLIDDASIRHENKNIRIVVPPNCYGGTNDQARRVAACLDHVKVVDLPVDGGNDMVKGMDVILDEIAQEDAIPYIIAEIPTNPRVEVPDLNQLKSVLSKERKTNTGKTAVDPVFILDQTFCPNVPFVDENGILSTIRAISYVSGSKFPSGGRCTAGYCVGNKRSESLMERIASHLALCDNGATNHQMEVLAQQLPSMNERISDAYKNTRSFVSFIENVLPEAIINFVSEELAEQGFTPSVFSLDLPTKGNTEEEKEAYKREMNNKLIHLMIKEIPNESKYCVSYGQLKGCYWTIPATSTQGTTKESDKDYIARVALSPDIDLELHKKVFSDFVESIS